MYTPCPPTNPGRWAGPHNPAGKKTLAGVGLWKTAPSKKRHPLCAMLVPRERGTEQAPRRCSRPSPATGLDWGVLGGPSGGCGTARRYRGRAAMEEGVRPGGSGKAQGCAFLGGRRRRPGQGLGGRGCAGLPPSYSWSTQQRVEGPGVPLPSQEVEGGAGRACSLQDRAKLR